MSAIFSHSIFHTMGILGVLIYIVAYGGLQFGIISGRGYRYPLLNAIAAILLLLSLSETFNLSSALIQIAWIIISFYGLIRTFIIRNRMKFSDDEYNFAKNALPNVPKELVRRLLNHSVWVDGQAGDVIIRQGEKVDNLVYFETGGAMVCFGDTKVANIEQGGMAGEMTCLDGSPASANVILNQPSRCIMFDAESLRKLIKNEPEIRVYLAQFFNRQMANKIAKTNQDTAFLIKENSFD